MRLTVILCCIALLIAAPCESQVFGGAAKNIAPTSATVAALPASAAIGRTIVVTDGTSGADCTAGGGTQKAWCRWSGTAWQPVGGGGSGGGGSRALNGTGVAAKCQSAVSATPFSFATTAAPAATCESDGIQGYLDFTASTAQTVYDQLVLPADWAGTLKLVLAAYSTSTNAPTIAVALNCNAMGATASPTFGTAQTISLTPAASSGRTATSTSLQTGATYANKACAVGDLLTWKLTITAAAAADLRVLNVTYTE